MACERTKQNNKKEEKKKRKKHYMELQFNRNLHDGVKTCVASCVCGNVFELKVLIYTHSHMYATGCKWNHEEITPTPPKPSFFFWNSWWWIELVQKTTRVFISSGFTQNSIFPLYIIMPWCAGLFSTQTEQVPLTSVSEFCSALFCFVFLFFGVDGGCFILFKYSVTVEPHFWDLALKVVWILS